MQEPDNLAVLVNRYLCGEITDEERGELDRLLAGSAANAELCGK